MMNSLEEFVELALNAYKQVKIDRTHPTTAEFELYLRRAIMRRQAELESPIKTKTLLQG